jgi:outer membrane protein assembly factor BamB
VEEEVADGKVVWSYNANNVWSAEKMANGNVLIAAYGENTAIEVNPAGEVVWKSDRINCLNAKPLPNGNVLVADYNGSRAVEIQKEGNKIVWEYALGGNCTHVQRLDNGNTLVAGVKQVREVSPDGKVVWEYNADIRRVFSAQRLANGNTLVADFAKKTVSEISPASEVVWDFGVEGPSDAFRLPDGNTLITTSSRFLEVTPDKKVLWSKEGCSHGSIRR